MWAVEMGEGTDGENTMPLGDGATLVQGDVSVWTTGTAGVWPVSEEVLPLGTQVLRCNLQEQHAVFAAHLSLCRFEEKRCPPMQMSEVDPELDRVYRKCTGGPSWSTVPVGSGET